MSYDIQLQSDIRILINQIPISQSTKFQLFTISGVVEIRQELQKYAMSCRNTPQDTWNSSIQSINQPTSTSSSYTLFSRSIQIADACNTASTRAQLLSISFPNRGLEGKHHRRLGILPAPSWLSKHDQHFIWFNYHTSESYQLLRSIQAFSRKRSGRTTKKLQNQKRRALIR